MPEEVGMSTFSLRMADEDYEALQAMALLTGQPMAVLVRAAIGETVRRFTQARHDLIQAEQARRRNAMAILAGRADRARVTQLPHVPSSPDSPWTETAAAVADGTLQYLADDSAPRPLV